MTLRIDDGVRWYRIEGQRTSTGTDEFGDPNPGHNVDLWVKKFRVEKETPKGVWLVGEYGWSRRWVSRTTRKRYAHATLEEAVASFRARKQMQRKILLSQLDDVARWLKLLDQRYPDLIEEKSR